MEHDYERRILRNPALTARVFWHLAHSYTKYGAGRAAELPHFLFGAAMVFHEATVERTHRMHFETGLHKAISECPDMLLGLQARLDEGALPTLRGLQVGTSAGILMRVDGGRFVKFAAVGSQLPEKIRSAEEPVSKLFACSRRLGAWFAMEDPLTLIMRWIPIGF